jgi:two-component system, OmpR family, sensor histidine kinase VicK
MSLGSLFNKSRSSGGGNGSGLDASQQAKVIIDSIEDGVLLIDSSQTIQMINPGAAKLVAWSAEEASGISSDLVLQLVNAKGEPIPESENPLHKIFKTGEGISSSDYSLLTREKQNIPIRLRVSPLMNNNKQTYMAVAVFNNISEEKSSERQRADFISTASHEMRTPVAAIEGYLALALNDKVATIDTRARSYLEKAHDSTQHLGQLFQDLLTSAKAEDGRLTSHPQVLELGQFLSKLSDDLRLVAEKKGLAMDFSGGGGNTINATREGGERVVTPIFYVFADPDRLREVITNLFDNAVKYTPEGKVTLGLTGNDQVVQCFVRDTGPGIPSEDIPHLFQKFYRVDNSATRTIGGTGLGLFICRKIIELYNGRIWCESEINKGSTFYINLPRLSSEKAQNMMSGLTAPEESKAVSSLASA